ncbi:MAG: DUF6088 family protein [Sediminibacterium sp.]|nr:DUF6088 family protein [Sediminibacterium sp.]
MASIQDSIEAQIKASNPGTIFFPSDFRGLGSEDAIRQSLSRLCKEGILDRLAQGIYLLPIYDEELGKLTPSMEKIAEAIAAKEHVRIMPTGMHALNKLGLSTQVPMNIVYLTDGPRRTIKVGKGKLIFKSTVPKKFAFSGSISRSLIIGLEEQNLNEITDDMQKRIQSLLKKEKPELLKHDLKLAPAKIHLYLTELLNSSKHELV